MIIIRKRAFARAALVGNPSDGYQGKTISLIVRNFQAEVVLYEWDTVDILLTEDDRARFRSVHDLARDVALHGYYGGIRLIKATVKRFVDYCRVAGVTLHDRNFSIRYQTTIPRQVGLAGSSAIITATLRCLMAFYDVDIPLDVQPSLVLSVERDELGVAAGLQDRVAQTYEGLTYMDFSREHERIVHGLPCYRYEPLDPALLPPLYVSYHQGFSEPTEVFHNDVRDRFLRGDEQVVGGMRRVAGLAASARDALIGRDARRLSDLDRRELRRPTQHLQPAALAGADDRRRAGVRRERELRRLRRRRRRHLRGRRDARRLAHGVRRNRLPRRHAGVLLT